MPRRVEHLPPAQAFGRVLAADVAAPEPVPRWDNSAMDGFAVRAADTGEGVELAEIETIAAGRTGTRPVVPGSCVRIMTGAPMPAGADAVVMREDTLSAGDGRVRLAVAVGPGENVRRAGEECAPGEVLLRAGDTLTAGAIGVCAAFGMERIAVAARPRVAILSTGDEVVPAGAARGAGQIWSSNSAALAGLVLEAGGIPIDCGNAPDELEATRHAFGRALAVDPDVIVSSGGVSVGDKDLVKEALAGGVQFWTVAMKPGKPLAYGTLAGRPVFGLPGNPVSAMVVFLQFVRPLLRRAQGDPEPFLPVVDAIFAERFERRAGRPEFVRVRLGWSDGRLVARPTGPQGSGMASSMARAHGFALLKRHASAVEEGDVVPVQVIDPTFLRAAGPGYRWGGRGGPG